MRGCGIFKLFLEVKYQLVLVCPSKTKNKVKPPTQSAENRVFKGKCAFESLEIYFLPDKKGTRRLDLLTLVRALTQP